MNSGMRGKTGKMAMCGLGMALTVAAMIGASIVPGAEMTFYALAGLCSGLVIMETGFSGGVLVYIGALLLSFILVPNKMALLPYGMFFGLYGFVKYFAEKAKSAPVQIAIKVIFFGIITAISFYFFKGLFLGNIELPNIPMVVIIIGGILMFLLYDYIFTLAVNIYRKRIKREKVNFKLSEGKDNDEKRQGQ